MSMALKKFKKFGYERTPKGSGVKSDGWCAELDSAWANGHYAVMTRDIKTEWGRVTHFFIRNIDNTDIPWMDKQIIKNKLAGYDKLAIEVFPPHELLVDDVTAYHLWVLHDTKLPFGIHKTQVNACNLTLNEDN